MSTIANAKVAHNYNRYNGYFFGCLLSNYEKWMLRVKSGGTRVS